MLQPCPQVQVVRSPRFEVNVFCLQLLIKMTLSRWVAPSLSAVGFRTDGKRVKQPRFVEKD